jgi:hypothetical protein
MSKYEIKQKKNLWEKNHNSTRKEQQILGTGGIFPYKP